jgi:hypothetical protein
MPVAADAVIAEAGTADAVAAQAAKLRRCTEYRRCSWRQRPRARRSACAAAKCRRTRDRKQARARRRRDLPEARAEARERQRRHRERPGRERPDVTRYPRKLSPHHLTRKLAIWWIASLALSRATLVKGFPSDSRGLREKSGEAWRRVTQEPLGATGCCRTDRLSVWFRPKN